MLLGRLLYHIVHLVFRKDTRTIVRNEIKYEVDLTEGVDLSVFVFGSFQKHICENKYFSLPKDAVVFDIGANCGIMTLQFAKRAPSGKVYAFEPTRYAFSRLKKNLELNQQLAERIVTVQSFVGSQTTDKSGIEKAYASWKVGGKTQQIKHSVHGGTVKSAEGIPEITLDDFCSQQKISRLDFIKIDTDGFELQVLKGAEKTIQRFSPVIIFEAAIYVFNEMGIEFADFLVFFDSLSYRLFNSKSCEPITAKNYRKHIPLKSTIDILAIPNNDRNIDKHFN